MTLDFRPSVSRFIRTAVTGTAREIAAFGTRGDGKTWGAFGAMIAHAQQHQQQGGTLPTKWIGAADTYQSHRTKTVESLTAPEWRGCWDLREDKHLAAFRLQGQDLVHLRLLGVEDQGGMDRLRAECHGLWFEEPAPSSVMVQSSGLSEAAWGLGLTSQRLPSYAHPAIMTLNYPDEDHWTWQRFVARQHAGTAYVRIVPGERATAEQRAEWERALADRPDLLARLLRGEPGAIAQGPQVALGFSESQHVVDALTPQEGRELTIGWDGGHTPTAVIVQATEGRVRILAAMFLQGGGTRQCIETLVRPWLGQQAPWALADPSRYLLHSYDPSMDTGDQGDTDTSPVLVIQQLLGGYAQPGPVSWDGRRDPLLAALNRMTGGRATVQVSRRWCADLVRALTGRWHYPQTAAGELRRDLPKKPNHPWEDLGDALCYALASLTPGDPAQRPMPAYAATAFSPFAYDHAARQAETDFDLFKRR